MHILIFLFVFDLLLLQLLLRLFGLGFPLLLVLVCRLQAVDGVADDVVQLLVSCILAGVEVGKLEPLLSGVVLFQEGQNLLYEGLGEDHFRNGLLVPGQVVWHSLAPQLSDLWRLLQAVPSWLLWFFFRCRVWHLVLFSITMINLIE